MLRKSDHKITLLVRHRLPTLAKRGLISELGADHFSVASHMPRMADVAWHPWNGTFFQGARRNVVTMHDVAPFAFPASDARKRRSQQDPFTISARSADRILTDSLFSRGEIEARLGVPASRISVVPLAADRVFSPGLPERLPSGLREQRYVLYVGTLEAHKNVETVVTAWRDALAHESVAFVIVGGSTVPSGVVRFHDVPSHSLRDLYRGALCVVLPSLYEGFGLPVIEALACGTPVLAARSSALPEVCGQAVEFVDEPRDTRAWEGALRRIARDEALRSKLSARGPERAAQFSWERTSDETLHVLYEAAT